MRWLRRIAGIVLFVATLYVSVRFMAHNADPVRVDYLFGAFEAVPLWRVPVIAFLAGMALTALVSLYPLTKARMRTRRYRKAARGLEEEIHELRSLPLVGAEPAGDGRREPLEAPGPSPLERGA